MLLLGVVMETLLVAVGGLRWGRGGRGPAGAVVGCGHVQDGLVLVLGLILGDEELWKGFFVR